MTGAKLAFSKAFDGISDISRNFCEKFLYPISSLKNDGNFTNSFRLANSFCGNFTKFSSPFLSLRCKKIPLGAFTLAEVLITLGVIGVVVAMTLPALIADHREKQTVNQVLAFYSKLSQATQYIINEEGEPGVWLRKYDANNLTTLSNKYKKYMKILTDCGKTRSKSCVSPTYVMANNGNMNAGGNFSGSGSSRYSMILQDGSAVAFFVEVYFSANPNNRNKITYAQIYYDTNGVKPPNRIGYDLFQFSLTDNGIYVYSDKEFRDKVYPYGYYDSYWIITHKNLDFQRCPDELKKGAAGCKKKKK